jgi:hypothetical protein
MAGQALGEGYKRIAEWIEPISKGIIVLIGLALVAGLAWVVIKAIQRLRRD